MVGKLVGVKEFEEAALMVVKLGLWMVALKVDKMEHLRVEKMGKQKAV